jgi:hypothetical protein
MKAQNNAAVVADATNNNEVSALATTNATDTGATMKTLTTDVHNAVAAPAAVYDMSCVIATMMTMSSTTLTDYLAMFYADTAQAVAEGRLHPVIKLLVDKGFARHFTEHNSLHSTIETEEGKLASIRNVIKYWNMSVLTKSAYEAATRPAPEPKAPKTPRAAGSKGNTLRTLADHIAAMSLSPAVDLNDRAAYAKIANALTLTNGADLYKTLMTIPKAAAIIVAAEAAIEAERVAAAEEAQRVADIEAQAMAAELLDMFN